MTATLHPAIRTAEPEPAEYRAAVEALEERGRFGMRLGLTRIRALLRALGHPERGLRGALVAGTNGKGSVIALCSAAIRAAGYRVGETPKPHLVSYRERLVVDGRPIAPEAFARLFADVAPVADRVARRYGPPTEFEFLTAMIFRWLAEAGIDVALVEVGIGGRLDATHAWDGGVAVVTNVDLDHTDRLGTTVTAIAREKAAIIMRGDRAVTGATGAALGVVRRRADRLGVPLSIVEPAPILGWDRDGLDVALPRLGPTRVGLRGRHQAANAAVADAVLDALEAAGIARVAAEARRVGFAAARWPGRLELLEVVGRRGRLDVLLDGAHNPAGAAALALALDDLRPFLAGGRVGRRRGGGFADGAGGLAAGARGAVGRAGGFAGGSAATPTGPDHSTPVVLLTATMVDKDVDGLVAALARATSLRGARVVTTTTGSERALPPAELADRWSRWLPDGIVRSVADPLRALDVALDLAEELDGPLVVAGSLYLVGLVRGALVGVPGEEAGSEPELGRADGRGGSLDQRDVPPAGPVDGSMGAPVEGPVGTGAVGVRAIDAGIRSSRTGGSA
ncbi:MAG: hypothetical protein KatS3mg065_1227 [Chloroflexota bacterium]|nr:MAG: hypothetical protein KatS3mg065_1227 [Chloroflexota bacterium]